MEYDRRRSSIRQAARRSMKNCPPMISYEGKDFFLLLVSFWPPLAQLHGKVAMDPNPFHQAALSLAHQPLFVIQNGAISHCFSLITIFRNENYSSFQTQRHCDGISANVPRSQSQDICSTCHVLRFVICKFSLLLSIYY